MGALFDRIEQMIQFDPNFYVAILIHILFNFFESNKNYQEIEKPKTEYMDTGTDIFSNIVLFVSFIAC
jgi:hypothetical protein